MRNFKGKYAVITGGAAGIGRAAANQLALEGISGLLIADINASQAAETAAAIESSTSVRCLAMRVDVSDADQAKQLIGDAVRSLGSVDILINSAGIAEVGTIDEIGPDRWDRTMNINLRGTYLCAREAFSWMKHRGGGKIVNIASMAARVGGVNAGADYVSSKGGVIALTKALAKQGAKSGIYVNALAPGFVHTQLLEAVGGYEASLVPLGRFGRPEEIATVIAFLCSDEASFITGTTIDVNGGMYM